MTTVTLGSTGITVNKNGFGALPIQRVSFEEAGKLLKKAYNAGMTYFDTGRFYTDSEEKMGAALCGVRDKIYIATKSMALTVETLRAEMETSLANMKTDYIDVFQFHNPPFCPKPGDDSGLYDFLLEAKSKGKIRHIGMTNHRYNVSMEAVDSGLYEVLQYPFSYLSDEKDIDMVYIRENSEGEYAGEGAWLFRDKPEETVLQHAVFSRKGCTRVIRYAFELAKAQNKSLTSISKGNALNYSMVYWDKIFLELSKEYPEVKTYSYLVDAAAMFMIRDPKRFEIVVTSNLFGDILTDLGAAIAGGMGLAAGANINPERKYPSMFEPIHGSAPDIAGKNIANPLATVWAVAQMCDFFGYYRWGELLIEAIEDLLISKETLTPDLGGLATTKQVGDAVRVSIEKLYRSRN